MQFGKRPSAVSLAGLVISACAALPGCTVGPDYVKPTVSVPANYKEAAADGTAWKVAQPGDHVSRGKWWTVYNDPLLNALQDVLTTSNQDLVVAQSRYLQARALVASTRSGYMPTVTAGASVTRFRASANGFRHACVECRAGQLHSSFPSMFPGNWMSGDACGAR
jgi:outer membrane protein TolC